MTTVLRPLPLLLCALLWVFLAALVQDTLSGVNLFLYIDGALLLVPARFAPRGTACYIVGVASLFADALRQWPFGLSATLLLPVLLILIAFRPSLRLRSDLWWLSLTAAINAGACLIGLAIFSLHNHALHRVPIENTAQMLPWVDAPAADLALAALAAAIASSIIIFTFGTWFQKLQLGLYCYFFGDLHDNSVKEIF